VLSSSSFLKRDILVGGMSGSVVRTSVFCWRTFPDLRLTYGLHVTTSWVSSGALNSIHSLVGKVSAMGQPTRPTQLSMSSESVNEYVIHVITWITVMETIKRQTRVAYGWLVVGHSVAAGLAYGL